MMTRKEHSDRWVVRDKIAIGVGVAILLGAIWFNIFDTYEHADDNFDAYDGGLTPSQIATINSAPPFGVEGNASDGGFMFPSAWWLPKGSMFVVGVEDKTGKYLFKAWQDDREIVVIKMISEDGGYHPLQVCGKIRGSKMEKAPMALMDCVVFE